MKQMIYFLSAVFALHSIALACLGCSDKVPQSVLKYPSVFLHFLKLKVQLAADTCFFRWGLFFGMHVSDVLF